MISKSDLKKPLDSLSNLRKEKVLKYRRGEEEERISVLGQESERKAIPWVQEDVIEQELKDKQYFWLICELLQKAKSKRKDYLKVLTQVFLHFMVMEKIPKKYFIEIEANNVGIKVEIKKTHYYGAFKISELPSYDFRACQILAMKLGNTIAKLEGYIRKSSGGISLPDSEDLKIYG